MARHRVMSSFYPQISDTFHAEESFPSQLNSLFEPQSLQSLRTQLPSFTIVSAPSSSRQVTLSVDDMASDHTGVSTILEALRPILSNSFDAFRDEVEKNVDSYSTLDIQDGLQKTVQKLRSEQRIPEELAARLELGIQIAKICNNSQALVKAADESSNVQSVGDFAKSFDTSRIQTILQSHEGSMTNGAKKHATSEAVMRHSAQKIRAEVFKEVPTATIEGIVRDDKVKLASSDPTVKTDLINVLSKMDDKAILNPNTALANTLEVLPVERRQAVTHELKRLSRVAAIAPSTTSLQALVNKGLTTSFAINGIPKDHFVSSMANIMPVEDAEAVHTAAAHATIRNQNLLVDLLQTVQGTGLQAIDGQESSATRRRKIQNFFSGSQGFAAPTERSTDFENGSGELVVKSQRLMAASSSDQPSSVSLNLESLFGSMDQPMLNESTTVYSAAAYLVDLLEYLRVNTAKMTIHVDRSEAGEKPSIKGTVLEMLFRRRPDIGNLQLSQENTDTILPYIDLANEIMESFIVNLDTLSPEYSDPWIQQLTLDAFNVSHEDSKELLSEPQNTNIDAYQVLANSSSSLKLPYHQPIDSQRVYLDFLKVPRVELIDAFRQRPAPLPVETYGPLKPDETIKLSQRLLEVQETVYDRQVDAEVLGLIQEEYLILTGEVLFSREFFQVTENIPALTTESYQAKIGLQPGYTYWGYDDASALLSTDAATKRGLQFVKTQLLPRSGIEYTDLIEIVQTHFINPNMPKGRSKTIFDEIRFSYKFLQTLVNYKAAEPRKRLSKLAEFLVRTSNLVHLSELLYYETTEALGSKVASLSWREKQSHCANDEEVRRWVYDHFENIGKVIVLDSGEGPRLPASILGAVVAIRDIDGHIAKNFIGNLEDTGLVRNNDGVVVAHVTINSKVLCGSPADDILPDNPILNDRWPGFTLHVVNNNTEVIGVVQNGLLRDPTVVAVDGNLKLVEWLLPEGLGGSHNINNVRLIHLDGSPLSLAEWDRLQKFIRLWKKLTWSIDETDRALTLGRFEAVPEKPVETPDDDCDCPSADGKSQVNEDSELITFINFSHSSQPPALSLTNGVNSINHPEILSQPSNDGKVTVDIIHNLALIKKIMVITGLPLEQLLTFWTPIPTRGRDALYRRLFFKGNVRATDPVFGPDKEGDFFTRKCKISDQLLVVLAAFGITSTDVDYLLGKEVNSIKLDPKLVVPDVLNIDTLSQIYRYSLLAKVLGVGIPDLGQVIMGFANPFEGFDRATQRLLGPTKCLELVEAWQEMGRAGFSWPQFRYVADDIKSPMDPLAPSARTVVQTAKTLYDGVTAIQTEHKLITNQEEATDDTLSAKLVLVFENAVVKEILDLLNGKTVHIARAPTITDESFPNAVTKISSRIKYSLGIDGRSSQLSIQGILTDDETSDLKSLLDDTIPDERAVNGSTKPIGQPNGNIRLTKTERDKLEAEAAAAAKAKREAAIALRDEWVSAIKRAQAKPTNVFHDFIAGILPADAKKNELQALGKSRIILAPDINESDVASNPELAARGKTPTQKRFFFLNCFMPFLQDKLARVLIEDNITSAVGFSDRLMAKTVLSNIAINRKQSGTTKMDFLLNSLRELAERKPGKNWNGYLAPITSDSYAFLVAREEKPQPLIIDAVPYTFEDEPQQEDPERLWATKSSIKLESGKLYDLQLKSVAASSLQWKPASGPRAEVPASALLPKVAQDRLYDVFVSLQKLAIVINNFKLSPDEILYIYEHYEDFEKIDFIDLTSAQLLRLQSYVQFRDSLPENTTLPLIQLFNWAANYESNDGKEDRSKLVEMISSATGWEPLKINQILDHASFTSGAVAEFRTAQRMKYFTHLIELSNRLGADIPRLFAWASPLGTSAHDFYRLHNIAKDIRKVARSRFDLKTWPDAVRPLSDSLRENQKNALIAFLLTQEEITSLGIYNADGLFEYFLIDTQMTPLVETSRIKQAIATVQVYIQRCLLGLEESHGVPANVLNRQRWEWMQKYRVWEANRKVFLYPENWIDPSLRDTKSELFRSLESSVLQKDLNASTVNTALKDYLSGVSEISNMTVVGLCTDDTARLQPNHIFCRTRTAPYTFYHNVFTRPHFRDWRKMEIEVPSYAPEDIAGRETGAPGVYFVPMAFDGRVIVFIPQIVKKTLPPDHKDKSLSTIGGEVNASSALAPQLAWHIKLSWTELRNGKWTSRQLCQNGYLDSSLPLPSIDSYKFTPVAQLKLGESRGSSPREISVYLVKPEAENTILCEWRFATNQLMYVPKSDDASSTVPTAAAELNKSFHSFGYRGNVLNSLQGYRAESESSITLPIVNEAPMAQEPDVITPNGTTLGSDITLLGQTAEGKDISESQPLYHTKINELVSSAAASKDSTWPLFSYLSSIGDKNVPDSSTADFDSGLVFGHPLGVQQYDELSRPFSLYNWELGLHAPMTLIDALLKAQQFDQALEVCHYVFNPMASGPGDGLSRFWVFRPFKDIKADQSLELWFQSFKDGVPTGVEEWRDHPFAPHVIARSRPKAYMKWIVTKYIEILIEYGDFYFRQNTLETIPNAIQMYILASHLYGPRGYKVPQKRPLKPYTYNELMTKFDAFSNALVQMEEAFPFSNQTPLPRGKLPGNTEMQVPNIFGFAGGLFFAIPDNPQLRALGERIDDRLFKIRHSQDINGIFRKLPLFEPPIDPALLVQATAQGLSLSSVLSDLSGPMPNYRFHYLLGRAIEMAREVRSFGQALLSAQERKDTEAYSLLRAKHESTTQNLVMGLKKLSLEEAQSQLEALQYSRNGPVGRMEYCLRTAGEDLSAIPGADTEFQRLSEKLQTPVDQGGLKLLPFEKEEMDLTASAADLTKVVGAMETLSGVLSIIPTASGNFEPLGMGASISFGGSNLAGATSAVARGISIRTNDLTFQAGNASRKAMALRALNDRLLQANVAGYEISSIDKQIVAGKVRVAMANREIELQQKNIDQIRETEDFLNSKYTNAELYTWMFGQTKTLFHNSYVQAYDMAKKVEKIFKFERPQLSDQTFIQPGYWNASRDGLLAGENLYQALKQIETAYIADRGYDYEVTKNISLRQIAPIQLMTLRETGIAEFAVPETLFDMDFPGHYLRRIKSISVTVPCVVGPYTGVNCTLRLMSHKYRRSTSRPSEYAENVSSGSLSDDRFATTNVPINAIAVSSGQNDSGLFELNFQNDRFLPFEGAGCISTWRLELPPSEVRPFDYNSVTDVILTMRYTSLEGGGALKDAATKSVSNFVKSVNETSDAGGLFALLDLKNEYAASWAKFSRAEGASVLEIPDVGKRLPLSIVSKDASKITAHDVWLLVDGELADDSITLSAGRSTETLTRHDGLINGFNAYEVTGKSLPVQEWAFNMQLKDKKPQRIWAMIRYLLA
ncbi:Toxin subunit YenA2 [Paramyrothecium foliicola]|nr:Toxin subunit YenA2 [Paramyrothecium foliicola]